MNLMRRASPFFLARAVTLSLFCVLEAHSAAHSPARSAAAQSPSGGNQVGTIDFTARLAPTGAHPEPVRQFTFYVLTRSYSDITKDVEEQETPPSRERFIDELKVSHELKDWLRAHDIMDLTAPGLDKLVKPDEILSIPEFLLAYQRSNSGGVTNGIPKPKFVEADKTANPARYEKQRDDYLVALKKFIVAHPESVDGMELELEGVNPQYKWSLLETAHQRRVMQMAPQIAQTKYLAAQTDTDLDGRASVASLPAGTYWISTLNVDAGAGDIRVRWDVPVAIQGGRTTHIELTNLNSTIPQKATP
jgi:hypothetical protein